MTSFKPLLLWNSTNGNARELATEATKISKGSLHDSGHVSSVWPRPTRGILEETKVDELELTIRCGFWFNSDTFENVFRSRFVFREGGSFGTRISSLIMFRDRTVCFCRFVARFFILRYLCEVHIGESPNTFSIFLFTIDTLLFSLLSRSPIR